MLRWIFLIAIVIITAGIIGFAETSALTEVIAKTIYFAAAVLLVGALVIRDVMRKEL